jgi:hypothetical protein
VSCWRPDRLSGLIFPQSLDFVNTACKIAWQLTRRGTGDSSPLAATFDGFVARIVSEGRRTYLGIFETPEAAHEAYVQAKRELHQGCTI